MNSYIIKRLWQLPFILGGITLLSFVLMHTAVGDAVDLLYDQAGAVSEQVKAARRAQLGLDQPLFIQYLNWTLGVFTGNLGISFVSGKPVFDAFIAKLPATLLLAACSILLTAVISIPLGILAAVRHNSWIDYLIRSFSFIGNSTPNFLTALILIYIFALQLGWLPVLGAPGDLRSIILPTLTLSLSMSAKYTRQVRAIVLDELGKPYVAGARARGIRESVILFSQVLRTALVTLITLFALSIGSLLGGTAIVESIFLWDGVGKLAVDAILMRDYPLVQAYVIWMTLLYFTINLAVDLLYPLLDPRVRLQQKGE